MFFKHNAILIICKEKTKSCLALLNKKIDNDNDR